ncbi:SPOR domain-containing protein [Sandaracinobacteroides saxicola]|uniref:SPOR domain-containing protein n=1 Tax=Sandaracinobacteroides saxicola TaxID=2759707 RepID=A0A7G5IHA2_9SPHN|nr:SPOR domain-containing protein [Sandaracinobacteroides saxicola]QMW22744.1 SPOR domain-containing protein [Sandaracinobacteroides saxicola]
MVERRGPSPADARPPWLEEAEEEAPTHTLVGRNFLWLVVIGLLLVAVGVAVGVALIVKRSDSPIEVQAMGGEVQTIPNPGPWKERPETPGGTPVEGQGQLVYDAGDGADPGGTIDLNAVPEAPVERPGTEVIPVTPDGVVLPPAATAPPPKPLLPPVAAPSKPLPPAAKPAPIPPVAKAEVVAKPVVEKAAPKPPVVAPKPVEVAALGGAGLLQLGAFSSEAKAREAWKGYSKRFQYLAGLTPVIAPVARDGVTLYRLRASGAADAANLCARLKVAGEDCSVVN